MNPKIQGCGAPIRSTSMKGLVSSGNGTSTDVAYKEISRSSKHPSTKIKNTDLQTSKVMNDISLPRITPAKRTMKK